MKCTIYALHEEASYMHIVYILFTDDFYKLMSNIEFSPILLILFNYVLQFYTNCFKIEQSDIQISTIIPIISLKRAILEAASAVPNSVIVTLFLLFLSKFFIEMESVKTMHSQINIININFTTCYI